MPASALLPIAAAAVLFLAFPALCAAQDDKPVARPEVKPGDSWSYRRIDFWTNKTTGIGTVTVTFANDRVIQTVTKVVGDEKEHDAIHTADWNNVSSFNGGIFTPDQGIFKFPLQVGKTYKAVYDLKLPRLGVFQMKHDRTVKVVGWEDIEVPAGKFRALKLESEGPFQRVDTSGSGTAKDVIWYVPEVKRFVKWNYEDAWGRGRNNWFGFELVTYTLQ